MKLELFKIISGVEALNSLKETNEMPFELAWQIDDILETCGKHYERFNNEKNSLVKKLGKPVKDKPEQYEIKKEDIELFNQEIEKISLYEIELNGLKKLKKSELMELKISKNTNLNALKIFIDE